MRLPSLLALIGLSIGSALGSEVEIDPPFALNSNSADPIDRDERPDVGSDGRGTWVTVWRSLDFQDDTVELSVSRSTDAGKSWSARASIETLDTNVPGADIGTGDVAGDGQGVWVAVYNASAGPTLEIRFARSADNGQTWGPPQLLAASFGHRPRLATDGQGNWIAVPSGCAATR